MNSDSISIEYVFIHCSVMLLQVIMQLTEVKMEYSGKRWLTKQAAT